MEEEIKEYEALLKKNLVRPSRMEIFIMDADGSIRDRLQIMALQTLHLLSILMERG